MRRLSSYRVFLTRQSEYHVRGHVCFGVRDRRTGHWIETHWALRKQLASAFPDAKGNMCSISSPLVGEPLWFAIGGGFHHTSPVFAVEEREYIELSPAISKLTSARPAQQAVRPGLSIRDTH